jgi:hypothetical protein
VGETRGKAKCIQTFSSENSKGRDNLVNLEVDRQVGVRVGIRNKQIGLRYHSDGGPCWVTKEVGQRKKNVPYSTASRPALGLTMPPVLWVLGTLFASVKRPETEADHSLYVVPRLRMI